MARGHYSLYDNASRLRLHWTGSSYYGLNAKLAYVVTN